MKLRWFLSGTVRQATEMVRQVRKLLNAQRDILSPSAIGAVDAAILQAQEAINSGADNATLTMRMEDIETAAGKYLKQYPNPGLRENIEVLLVAIAVAMAIRTFFLQPFKIPTGSMQPTLYGVTAENLVDKPGFKMPGFLTRVFDACFYGRFYHQLIAEDDGQVVEVPSVEHFIRFINKQTIVVQYANGRRVDKTLWFAPDERFESRSGLDTRSSFRKGEPIVRFVETTGDHLFVDRLTYNFRRPQRGEIIVFMTRGIEGLTQDQFYIKRLVGLPNETISIGQDRHVRVNGTRLDASAPHFENVYSFATNSLPRDSHYSGHIPMGRFADDSKVTISDKHLMVFGDNTANSLDSRYWGELCEQNVIGKSCFVYWPISKRFGVGYHQ
jgi:signal peptidase I